MSKVPPTPKIKPYKLPDRFKTPKLQAGPVDKDGDLIVKNAGGDKEKLTMREEQFCLHCSAIGNETFSNATRSAEMAGYKCPEKQGWKVFRKQKIQDRISELIAEHLKRNKITVDTTLCKLENLRVKSEAKGDLVTALGAVKLEGSFLSMFSEKFVLEVSGNQSVLAQAHMAEAKRIASIVLSLDGDGEMQQLPEFTPPETEAKFSNEENTDAFINAQFEKGIDNE